MHDATIRDPISIMGKCHASYPYVYVDTTIGFVCFKAFTSKRIYIEPVNKRSLEIELVAAPPAAAELYCCRSSKNAGVLPVPP